LVEDRHTGYLNILNVFFFEQEVEQGERARSQASRQGSGTGDSAEIRPKI
jgi:hypothetical protein